MYIMRRVQGYFFFDSRYIHCLIFWGDFSGNEIKCLLFSHTCSPFNMEDRP